MTKWLPHERHRRTFALANGDLIVEPETEISESGRKVRILGSEAPSWYSRDYHDMIRAHVDGIAEKRKTRFWMGIDPDADLTAEAREMYGASARFDLHEKVTAWWSFKHPTLPMQALVFVVWGVHAHKRSVNTLVKVLGQPKGLDADVWIIQDQEWDGLRTEAHPSDYTKQREARDWLVANQDPWMAEIGYSGTVDTNASIRLLLKAIAEFDSMETVRIPDMRDADLGSYGWLTLQAHETNVNHQLISDLREYLDDNGMEAVADAYRNLLEALRGATGVVLPNLDTNQFLNSILAGRDEDAVVTFELSPLDPKGRESDSHSLHVNLLTGAYLVSCSVEKENIDPNEIAHAWEEARLIAQLSGEEDFLLAYARAYRDNQHAHDAHNIVTRRQPAVGL